MPPGQSATNVTTTFAVPERSDNPPRGVPLALGRGTTTATSGAHSCRSRPDGHPFHSGAAPSGSPRRPREQRGHLWAVRAHVSTLACHGSTIPLRALPLGRSAVSRLARPWDAVPRTGSPGCCVPRRPLSLAARRSPAACALDTVRNGSETSGTAATLKQLTDAGLRPKGIDRAHIPFDPVLRSRKAWPRRQGIVGAEGPEELVVIRARKGDS